MAITSLIDTICEPPWYGTITYHECYLKSCLPLCQQIDFLKEDMLQIEFGHGYLLDVGWQPSFERDGSFKISLIKDYQWDTPVFLAVAYTLDMLQNKIHMALNILTPLIVHPQ